MTATSPNAAPADRIESPAPPVQSGDDVVRDEGFDLTGWSQPDIDDGPASAGGRKVLAIALGLLAILWTAYIGWAAGQALASEPLGSPAFAQWAAIATGPLALLGLAWLVFGRTRRKEAERFTRSVITMRTEARSLEALLQVLSRRINDSRSELTMISSRLMQLGDDASNKLGGITREFDSSSERLARHGQALDRAAELARTDIAVLLDDLPRAEEHARAISTQLREAASETATRTGEFDAQVGALTQRTREADEAVSAASQRLIGHLTQIESAGAAAAERVGEAETSLSSTLDQLLERTSAALDEIRAGIDTQSQAVSALVQQAAAGMNRAGVDASQSLAGNVNAANAALDTLSSRVAEQDRASQHMVAEIGRALGDLDQHFASVAQSGNERAQPLLALLAKSRGEVAAIAQASDDHHQSIESLAERTEALRTVVEQLSGKIRGQLGQAITEAGSEADHLVNAARSIRPEIEWMRDAAREASERLGETGTTIADQQDRLAALLATLDDGVGGARENLSGLSGAIADTHAQAAQFQAETGPALVDAMVQIKEAASHASQRAREAIAAIIPESAEGFSDATRAALEKVISETIEERLRGVEAVAARAVESARSATDRLTQQMLVLGQSATALEEHYEKQQEARREGDSETFARRVSLLIDSMHSASIDVGKILSEETDEKAWDSYLKGDRGVFTRRAARLIGSSEARSIRAHYESDGEFQQSVNRYIHDFEAMLRRVMAEREGGAIAVTLMSSDMGKLYAALSESLDRRRQP
ncbi:hypothetical protein H8M03_00910 [Sphingomonas sabuli]|uniref:ATPase n=1 Tax=Sphingomonas sabuli TaxID=2764186 RepID=A0A7G9L2V7_9SPHN|nr:hypothetical protein [Sphingomonas sabuli]QNM82956.1 hypothetical protein H8M03_00910 [Sphingomonas sabuli]